MSSDDGNRRKMKEKTTDGEVTDTEGRGRMK
jgi:hypothetical protein